MLNGKATIIRLIAGLIKSIVQTSKYFPELKYSGGRAKFE